MENLLKPIHPAYNDGWNDYLLDQGENPPAPYGTEAFGAYRRGYDAAKRQHPAT